MSAKPITLLFLGATGETGKQALLHALSSPSVGSIHALGRTPPSLPTSTANLDKLTTTTVDFEALLAGDTEQVNRFKAVDADVVLITLGTTRAAAGDRFEKIDREYVVAGAKAARIESKEQKVVYVSSAGSNASSPFLYSKSKALTEQGIAALGYTENVVFRPGMLAVPGGRGEARLLESIAAKVTGLLSHVTAAIQIETPILGAALVRTCVEGQAGLAKASLGKKELLAGREALIVNNRDARIFGTTA